jgi:Short C-terminal domain/Domain of unknwon function (DUF3824)
MMRRRRVGRPIARAAVGTAVVAGTAGAVHHHQAKKWAKDDYENQAMQQQQMEQEQYYDAPPPQQYAPPPPAPSAGDDMTDKLNQLAELHASGVLSDEEFAAAKQKVLGI